MKISYTNVYIKNQKFKYSWVYIDTLYNYVKNSKFLILDELKNIFKFQVKNNVFLDNLINNLSIYL